MTNKTFIKSAAATVWALSCAAAQAQTAPDAGRLLQEQSRPPELPQPAQGITIQSPPLQMTPGGGAQVVVQSINFTGNTRFSAAQLQAVLADSLGKPLDLAGLRGLTNLISEHYRAAGYAFASAYLPPQPLKDGALQIAVVEGQYGQIKVQSNDDQLASAAQAFLAPLRTGQVIESKPLERLSLILDDLPGLKITPILRPGQEVGTGDLDMKVERTERFAGDLRLDNHGNRYTGRTGVRLNLDINSPFALGDQLTLRSLLTDKEAMRMGTLGYSLPLGSSGLRGNISHARTDYELGGSLADSQSTGTAAITSVGLSYPLLRSQQTNVSLSANWQDKQLNDMYGDLKPSTKKTSNTLPITISFDARNTWGGGGVTYGSLAWTSGKLNLDSTLAASDVQAQTAGRFDKLNLDVARIQALNWGGSSNFTLFGRLSAQHAGKNLDSSEDFGLGGATGVRAYPSGEAFGDEGWLAQIELRYSAGAYAPYAFYDAGNIKTNAKPVEQAVSNERNLAGAGFGLRYQRGPWSADAALAWRLEGGLPQSDTQDLRLNGPQAWINVAFKF